ncbi:deleted in malignant brain tumors 1 protein-like [Sceloporus undulatus]|uniref:deleted in malignant brain tumors 1 protein-like n=1 Tax=Sceloporus undulatus TaxID=8520 RepID=UPI001C4CA0C7|nr:deleted in malignant brain tumors 1 protein-like [Sceloporus undulatus]
MKAVIAQDYLISKCGSQCHLYLSDPACKPVITRQHYIFYIPYDGCDTRRENTGSTSSFSNTVSNSGSGVNLQFRFTCQMEPRQMTEVTHNVDEYESTKQVQMQKTQIHVKFLFYDSPSFLHPWNNLPYFMNLNQGPFFQATLYSFNQNLILFIDTCEASNTNDFTAKSHVIIKRGCIQDNTYTDYFTQNRRITHFRFKPFRVFSRYSTVYLQCKIVVCHAYDYSSRCYQGCLSRNKREASSDQEQLGVLGPLELE